MKIRDKKALHCVGAGKIRIILLFAGILCLPAVANTGAKQLNGRIYLTGEDLSAWRGDTGQWEIVGDTFLDPENEKLLSNKPGTGVSVNGPKGKTTHLISKAEFGDVKAHIEFMISKGSNSGAYFAGRYELQIYDSYGVAKDQYPGIECGGIYERWDEKRKPKGYEGRSPRVNASRPAGQWQTFDVIFRAPRFDESGKKISNARFEKIIHNGVIVHEDVELTGPTRSSAYDDEKPTGPLMLQGDHGPVAYRNIYIEQAGPNPVFAVDTNRGSQSAAEQVEMLKKLGYAGIGCTGFKGLIEMLGELYNNNLRLFTVYLDVNTDPAGQKYDPELNAVVKLLKGHNTILWLNVTGGENELSPGAGETRTVEIIREIADIASESGARVAIYPNAGSCIERLEDALRIVKKADRTNVGVTFNLTNHLKVTNGRDMESLIKSAMPHLYVVTINGLGHPGESISNFLKTLVDSGYTGPVGLQDYGTAGDTYQNLSRSIDAWHKFSEQLGTANK